MALKVKGAAKFKKELVKSMDLSYFAPVDYSRVYGQVGTVTMPSQSSLKMDVTKAQADLVAGNKAIANHLFHNDDAAAVVGFKIEKYDCLTNDEGAYISFSKDNVKSFVYKTTDNKNVVNLGTWDAPKYYQVEVKEENGKYGLVVSDTETPSEQVTLAVLAPKAEYFSLANFTGTVDKKYQGGKIY